MKDRNVITLQKAEVIINNWHVTKFHRQASQFLLDQFHGLQGECARLMDEVERLQPPIDSTGIIPVGDHVREIKAREKIIDELRAENSCLKRRCVAATLYGATSPKDPAVASAQASFNINKTENQR